MSNKPTPDSVKFYETDEFKKLNEKWKTKLSKKGFEDIEYNEATLKKWALKLSADYNSTTVPATAEYYRLAEHFLNSKKFEDHFEKLIWRLHSEGYKLREIVRFIKQKQKTSRVTITKIIKALAKEMLDDNLRTDDDR